MGFPTDFVWGAASAAYQVEGAAAEDGKGPSVWDMFCRKPGAIWLGQPVELGSAAAAGWEQQSGEIACDHYHRYRDDVALMREIGLKGYRFSVSWPRVLPTGRGPVSAKGLDFYQRLVDELLAAGITPFVTLFHWDYPYDLYCRGGWLNAESPDWFAEYAQTVVGALSDRVRHWMTFNEPMCFIGIALQSGVLAPGDRLPFAEVLRAAHHALLAHGKAVQAIRGAMRTPGLVGCAPAAIVKHPVSAESADVEAARKATFAITSRDLINNTWWMDPMYLGRYPEDGLKLFGRDVPTVRPGDMETIRQPLDFCGVNLYRGNPIRCGVDGVAQEVPLPTGYPQTTYQWPITPEAMHWGPRFLWERYRKPIYITENGLANMDWISLDGAVHDPQRIDFTARYLLELEKAMAAGVDVRGYFYWSIMDNFEWHEGYRQRFGLIYVDYPTQRRVLKDSAYWYRGVIRSNGGVLHA